MYAIVGATGHTGNVAAQTLLSRGKKVRVVVRDTAKAKPFTALGAESAVAEVTDTAALAKAFAGAEGAYLLIPPNVQAPNFRQFQDRASRAMADAVRTAKVPHVVALSSIGADVPTGNGPIAGLYVLEQALRELAGTRSTFIRAGYFMENLGGALGMLDKGIVPSFFPANAKLDMIATSDIGELAASLLVEGAKETSALNFASPPISMNEVAAAVSRITGKPVTVQEAPLEAVVPTFMSFGMPESLAALYREMIEGFVTGRIKADSSLRQVSGKTGVEVVLRGLLGKS